MWNKSVNAYVNVWFYDNFEEQQMRIDISKQKLIININCYYIKVAVLYNYYLQCRYS